MTRPVLLNSCALAATAAEARYRINPRRPRTPRASRIVGLDSGASDVVRELAGQSWNDAHFICLPGPLKLNEELAEADFVLMIATANDGAAAASAIGDACVRRGIMTAGVVLNDSAATDAAVAALRPHARVLVVTGDRQDIAEIMSAVGA
jgi:hypothetical protein